MALPAIENFAGGAGNVGIPPWLNITNIYTLLRDGSGHGTITCCNGDGYDAWAADTFPDDQYAQVGFNFNSSGAGNNYVYLFLRGTYSGGIIQSGYWFWSDGSSDTAILRVDAGVQTVLGTANATTFASGDVMKVTATGPSLELLKNGTAVITVSDSTYSSGQPGLGGFTLDSAISLVSFQGDAIGGGGGGGGVHSGLTGTGYIAVTTPVGVLVDMTGISSAVGAGQGYPTPRYHVGSISFSADNAHFSRLAFLSQPSEIFVCPFPTVGFVGYSFAPGITGTITEIASF